MTHNCCHVVIVGSFKLLLPFPVCKHKELHMLLFLIWIFICFRFKEIQVLNKILTQKLTGNTKYKCKQIFITKIHIKKPKAKKSKAKKKMKIKKIYILEASYERPSERGQNGSLRYEICWFDVWYLNNVGCLLFLYQSASKWE